MVQVAIIGGGHNGLAAAITLAKAGRKVIVLEAREQLGGLAAPIRFGDNDAYTAPGIWHDTRGVRPHIAKALGLAQHGLKRAAPPHIYLPRRDADPAWLSARAIEGNVTPEDAAKYSELLSFLDKLRPVLSAVLDRPPPGPESGLWPLFSTGLSVRRLGAHDMMELLRLAPMCIADLARDRFQDERIGAALAVAAVEASFMGPWSAGSAASWLMRDGLAADEIVGGPAALTAALRKAAQAAGVQIRTHAKVTRIVTSRRVVTGLSLDSGETIDARWVLSSCDPKQTFLRLIGAQHLPVNLAQDMQRWRTRGTSAKLHLALDGPLSLIDGSQPQALRTGETLDDVERAFDSIKYGRHSDVPVLDVRVPSLADPSLAPEGHHVVSILLSFAPYAPREPWTDVSRANFTKAAIAALAVYCPKLPDQILAHQLLTPADLERDYQLTGGHLHHGEHAPDQLLFMRPSADCGHYATPIKGLFLGGSGTHPGGGLTCLPGVLAANTLLDLT